MRDYLEFEKPLREIEEKIEKLSAANSAKSSVQDEIRKLHQARPDRTELYQHLTPWQRTQLARHPQRPITLDYINFLTRGFQDSMAIARLRMIGPSWEVLPALTICTVMVIGHQKGDTERTDGTELRHAQPGRLSQGVSANEAGGEIQPADYDLYRHARRVSRNRRRRTRASRAIARNLLVMSRLTVPIISVVIGEGGSGGALALGVADRVLMLEHSVYSVISPEGCAAILWDDPAKIPDAADDAENDRRRSFQARRDRRSDPGTDRRRPPRSGDRRKTHRQIVHHPSRSVNRSQPRALLSGRDQKYRNMGVVVEPAPQKT